MTVRITIDGARDQLRLVYSDETGGSIDGVGPRSLVLGPGGYPAVQVAPGRLGSDPTGQDVQRALDQLAARQLDDAQVAGLGEYMFAVLFGDTWAALRSRTTIELCLAGEAACPMPWELVRDTSEYLLRTRQLVRRVLGDPATEVAPVVSLGAVPRVLFVVGSHATDPDIRAGAEYLGILRQARRLRTHLLLQATVAQVREAIERFAPDVVHFICHGAIESGRPVIQLLDDNQRTQESITADNLEAMLRGPSGALPIVVFNACMSGVPVGVHQVEPLAARLCRRGAPLAIGMSGTVDDQASRVFARSWYAALAAGKDLVAAAHRARQHMQARLGGAGYDWGLATLFLRSDVKTVGASSTAAATRWLDTAEATHRAPDQPTYVGRWRHLQTFDLLLAPRELQLVTLRRPLQILGISAAPTVKVDAPNAPELGLTYTCLALAARAAAQGHLVIHLDRFAVGYIEADVAAAASPDAATVQILRPLWLALVDAAQSFGVPWRPAKVATAEVAIGSALETALDKMVRGGASVLDWSEALTADLDALAALVRQHSFAGAAARVVVIIDDLHKLKKAFRSLRPALQRVLRPRAAAPELGAVFVLAFKVASDGDPDAKLLIDWLQQGQSAGLHLELRTFDADYAGESHSEAWLAHRQNLLAWREPRRAESIALVPRNSEMRKTTLGLLADMATHPGDLKDDAIGPRLVASFRRRGAFVEADDETLLRELSS
jgi:hypothetical protein